MLYIYIYHSILEQGRLCFCHSSMHTLWIGKGRDKEDTVKMFLEAEADVLWSLLLSGGISVHTSSTKEGTDCQADPDLHFDFSKQHMAAGLNILCVFTWVIVFCS